MFRPATSFRKGAASFEGPASPRRAGTLARLVILAGAAVLGSCEQVSVTSVEVAAIRVEPTGATLSPGDTLRLAATPLDASGNPLRDRPVVWTSQDTTVATVDPTGLVEARAAGEAVVRASAGGVQGTATIVVPEPPRVNVERSEVIAEPSSLPADGESRSVVTVRLRDDQGILITDSLMVTLRIASGPGELSTANPAFDPETGAYSGAVTSTVAGETVVAADWEGTALAQEALVEFVAGPAASMTITAGQGQTGTAGEPLADSLEVQVADAFGNPVAGVEVTWSPGAGSAAPAASDTRADGRARTRWTLGPAPGDQTLEAAAEGVADGVTFTALTGVGGVSASESSVVASPAAVMADGEEASTITVTLRDAQGNLITEERTVTLSITSGPGVLSATSPPYDQETSTYMATVTSNSGGSAVIRAVADGVTLEEEPTVQFLVGDVSPVTSSAVAEPASVTADGADASVITVTLRDAEGNLLTDPLPVTLLVASGPGELSTGSPALDPGTHTYSATVTSTQSGTATIVVVADAVTLDDRPQVGFVAGPVSPDESSLAADPTQVAADGSDTSTLTVTLRDAQRNVITEEQAVSLAVVSGPGAVGGVDFDPGTNTYSAPLTSSTPGTATVQAEANGVAITQQAGVDFVIGGVSPTASTVAATPTTVPADGTTASTVTVELRDGGGNAIGGRTSAAFSVELTGAAVATGVTETATAGTYQFGVTNTATQTVTVTVTVDGVTLADQPTVAFVAGPAAQIVIVSGNNQTGTAGAVLADPLQIRVSDASDHPVAGVEVSWTAADGSGAADPQTSLSSAEGFATTAWTLGPGAGGHTLQATAAGVADPVTFSATAEAGTVSPTASTVAANPATVPADGTTASTVTVELRDGGGNAIGGRTSGAFSVELTGAAVATTVTQTATAGTYQFGVTNTETQTVTVTVTVDGVTLADQPTVAFVAGPAAQIVIVSGNNQTGTAGAALADPLQVRVSDASDHPVEGVEVTWTTTDGSGTANPLTSLSSAEGLATTSWTLGSGADDQSLQATAAGVATPVTFSATAEPGAVSATESTVAADPATVPADGTTASTVTVELRDGGGNAIGGRTNEDFSVALTGSAVRTAVTETATAGTYQFGVTNSTPQTVTVTVTVDGVTLADAPEIVFTAVDEAGAVGTGPAASTSPPVGGVRGLQLRVVARVVE